MIQDFFDKAPESTDINYFFGQGPDLGLTNKWLDTPASTPCRQEGNEFYFEVADEDVRKSYRERCDSPGQRMTLKHDHQMPLKTSDKKSVSSITMYNQGAQQTAGGRQ